MIGIALILLLINYIAYLGVFIDKSFCSRKQALLWLTPYLVLWIAIAAYIGFIWEAVCDAWHDLN